MTPPARILAVDDNELNLEILEELLADDFNLEFAENGEQCLEVAASFRPDIILLDIMMPGIDGYEVCRRIRADIAQRRTKVIMVSAKAMVSERMKGYDAGANDYLTKPFEKEELLAKIRVFLELRSAEEVKEARLAGMAEVSAGVLHNVGNVLNSVNVSATRARSTLRASRVGDLERVAQLCSSQGTNFAEFIATDERGHALPRFLAELAKRLTSEHQTALDELDRLMKRVDHVCQIITLQQGFARGESSREEVSVEHLVEDALSLIGPSHLAAVRLETLFDEVPHVWTDQNRAAQVLVNVVKNACEAVRGDDVEDPRVTIRVFISEGDHVGISVSDNGKGLEDDELVRVFHHGYTTKDDGHGFGLHSSALTAREIGGSLLAHSDGRGTGATFTLRLPLGVPEEKAA